jgi:uncharacterized membrane protein
MRILRTIEVVAIGICGALYAGFGYLTHLGLFTPVIGVVRFWPAVVVPAVFSILFGPLVGGLGAALGIFISDMMIHGDALLSLTVGVPSNLLAFYLIGYIERRKLSRGATLAGTVLGVSFALSSVLLYVLYPSYFSTDTSLFFVGLSLVCVALTLGVIFLTPKWRGVNVASVIGLGVGSVWIGLGVLAYSRFFVLPTGEAEISLFAALGWFIWTYFTEIPFLLLLVPPILKACYAAFSQLKREEPEASESGD